MVERPTTEAIGDVKPRSFLMLHKRTMAVVTVIVILPWCLIAMCGTPLGGYGFFWGRDIQHFVHGWPLVHFQRLDIPANHHSGASAFEHTKGIEETKQAVADFVATEQPPGNSFYNLRLRRKSFQDNKPPTSWADPRNWPFGEGESLIIHKPFGWLVNLTVLAVSIVICTVASEFRIRKYGSLFRFQLKSMLVLVGVMACGVAALTHFLKKVMKREYDLERLSNSPRPFHFINFQLETTLPECLSQILNHGNTPFGQVPGFHRIKSGRLTIKLYQPLELDHSINDAETLTELENCPLPIRVEVVGFDPCLGRALSKLKDAPVDELEINYRKYARYEITGIEKYGLLNEEELPKGGNQIVQTSFHFKRLESLELHLDRKLDQPSQLSAVLHCNALSSFAASHVNRQGANFVLEHIKDFPANSSFQFLDEVPQETIDEIEKHFSPNPDPGLRSVVPVVG